MDADHRGFAQGPRRLTQTREAPPLDIGRWGNVPPNGGEFTGSPLGVLVIGGEAVILGSIAAPCTMRELIGASKETTRRRRRAPTPLTAPQAGGAPTKEVVTCPTTHVRATCSGLLKIRVRSLAVLPQGAGTNAMEWRHDWLLKLGALVETLAEFQGRLGTSMPTPIPQPTL